MKMTRTRTCFGAVAFVLLLAAVYFEPTRCVRGWLWGEAFFDGRPTSFWRGIVVESLTIDWPNFPKNISWSERVRMKLGWESRYTSFLLMCDVDADPVLRELAEDADPHVAAFATDVLNGPRGKDEESKKIGYGMWIHFLKKHNMR